MVPWEAAWCESPRINYAKITRNAAAAVHAARRFAYRQLHVHTATVAPLAAASSSVKIRQPARAHRPLSLSFSLSFLLLAVTFAWDAARDFP